MADNVVTALHSVYKHLCKEFRDAGSICATRHSVHYVLIHYGDCCDLHIPSHLCSSLHQHARRLRVPRGHQYSTPQPTSMNAAIDLSIDLPSPLTTKRDATCTQITIPTHTPGMLPTQASSATISQRHNCCVNPNLIQISETICLNATDTEHLIAGNKRSVQANNLTYLCQVRACSPCKPATVASLSRRVVLVLRPGLLDRRELVLFGVLTHETFLS